MNIDYTNDGLHLLGKGYFEMGRERKTLYYTEMKKVLFLFLSLFCYTCLWAQKKVKVTCMENGITYGARIENREAESYSTRLQVSDLYTDNMVLQRDVPLKIHGKANVGELVSVSIAQQKVTARVDNNGRWFVLLTPLQADLIHYPYLQENRLYLIKMYWLVKSGYVPDNQIWSLC